MWARETSPGRGRLPPPYQPRAGDSVVRRPEGTVGHELSSRVEDAADAVHGSGLERLGEAHLRKNRWDSFGQHGFSGTRWTDHEDVVPSGTGHFESSPGRLLAFDIPQIRERTIRGSIELFS